MMKQILFLLVAILLLSGCTVEPAALALIPTPVLISTPVPERPYQPCEPDREEVSYMIYDGADSEIIVYCGDLSVDDRWLRAWAKDAIARDDASRMMKFWEAGVRTDGATAFYMNFFLEADRSCLEDRGELARLIETYAEEYRSREHIDFPLLAAANVLRSDVTATSEYTRATNQDESPVAKVDCSEKFAALSATPDPPPLCLASHEDEVGECFNVAPGSISTSAPSECNTEEAMIAPGQTVTDEVSDELAAHIDITQVSTALSGETLTVVFHLRDVPESLTFDRTGIKEGYVEYKWEVSIDVDNDQETGYGGFEYTLSALHFVQPGDRGNNTVVPIGERAHANTWKVGPDGSTSSLFSASIEVSVDASTITLTGDVPGITADSRLAFKTFDYRGGTDTVGCPISPGSGMELDQCDAEEAMITPGQTVTDEASDALAAHIDISQITTALSGETLTVVFHLRDVPERLTFDRTGIKEGYVEYKWEVSIDVDNDQETGFGGFEYTLSALYFVPLSSIGANTTVPIGDKVPANVWSVAADGSTKTIKDAIIEVSVDADTITLTGDVPGITADSRLAFKAYDYLSGPDTVGCHNWQSPGTAPVECDSDEAIIMPGQTVTVDTSHALAAHIDITGVSTTLSGETLTAVFHLRDVPETLTFDRTGIRGYVVEYNWKVSIDVDYGREAGAAGIDYTLSAGHSVPPSESGGDVVESIASKVQANTWERDGDHYVRLDDAGVEVSTQADTITLVGDILGITAESRLVFEAYDFFDGSDEVACQVLSAGG